MNIQLTVNQVSNFWKKVSVGSHEECWNWKAYNWKGYGSFAVGNRRNEKSHRISWTLTFGSIPEGLFVCHKCDNPSCCNPYHLFLGTNADNMRDMVEKGRSAGLEGEENPAAKLNLGQVVRIRNLYEEGLTQLEIGKMFNVSRTVVGAIVRKEIWK